MNVIFVEEDLYFERTLMNVIFVEEDLYFLPPNGMKLYVFAHFAFESFEVQIHHTQK